ncbi:hypothetical protein AK88_00635 [Plasmodium fragile]|uniref:Uncharacterized protein n=1 Tax=Plasmodium fragile TaxID=5857 RepID=A0A0D9QRG6_PLAFR|nr:uncharacterized protein AK88_00635 [Plasmodium fragile]KJP89675.1 hypothetical protein AK88_00635 [Plasmodium fragile]
MESTVGNGVGSGMGSFVEGGGAHYALPRDEDIDEFLTKVNDVTEKVQHILSGKITVEEMQKEEQELLLKEKIKQIREAEKREEEHRRYIMGVGGSGTKDRNYKCFCTHCLVEFKYMLTTCPRCSGGVITKEQRLRDLQDKVNQYKEKKKKRDARRAAWKNWQRGVNQNKDVSEEGRGKDNEENDPLHNTSIPNRVTTDYEKWNHYEPSSDTFDEDEKIPYVPKHNKHFHMLEQKIQSDVDKKNEQRKVAHSMKLRGNEFFKKRKYIQAIECYEQALQVCKDYLEIHNNLALCYLKTYRYDKAIHTCNEVIQYYNVFKEDFRLKKDTLFKSHLRKGLAWYKLFNFEEALASFKFATEIYPGDVEASEYVQKCERMVRRGTQLGTTLLAANGASPPLGTTNNGHVTDLFQALSQLAKMDLTKDGQIFLETLKGVKRCLKGSEKSKLAFYSNVYSINDGTGGACCGGGIANRKGKTTFLAFCADKLEQILFCVKKGQTMETAPLQKKQQKIKREKLPKYTSLITIALIDLITFILDDEHHCADFCLNAVNPVITLYQLNKINKGKAMHLLNSMGRNTQGRKLLHERVIQGEDHSLLGKLLTRIGHLIDEDRSVYSEEQRTRLIYLTECIITLESVRRYAVHLHEVTHQREKTNEGTSTTRCTQKSKTNGTSDTPKEGDPWKELQKRTAKMYKHKFELANLFGIISHLTLNKDARDVIEKKFIKHILNIIIYVNELFYSSQGLNCNCLSLLVNLVGNTNVRTIIMSACWPHMMHFVEKAASGENLLENVLSLLLNLTSTWKEQMSKADGAKTLIREGSLWRMISCMGSANMRVAELSCLILSRLYTYAYCGVVHIEGEKSADPAPKRKEEKVCESDLFVSAPQEDTSNENQNAHLVYSLKKKIEKENDQQIHLDEYSFNSIKKFILCELESPRGSGLTIACVNLLCSLATYTDFLLKLLYEEEESKLGRLTNRLVSLFVQNKSKVEKDNSTSIMVKNVASLFTQVIKILTVRKDTNWGNASVVSSIKKLIPHAAELVNNGIHNDGTSKGISFFLSYCFINAHLKSEVLASFHNDVERVCAVLRCGGG